MGIDNSTPEQKQVPPHTLSLQELAGRVRDNGMAATLKLVLKGKFKDEGKPRESALASYTAPTPLEAKLQFAAEGKNAYLPESWSHIEQLALQLNTKIKEANTDSAGKLNLRNARADIDVLVGREIAASGDYKTGYDFYGRLSLKNDGIANFNGVLQLGFEMYLGYSRWLSTHATDEALKNKSTQTAKTYKSVPWGDA